MQDLTEEKLELLQNKALQIRKLLIKTLTEAKSGHTAGPLGMADIFSSMYFHVLNHNPKKPDWEERDRLVLSNGHICPVQYVTLALSGYFPIEELTTLRKLNSRLQGHPHRNSLPGIETTSGPLGEGLGEAIGVALAGKMDNKNYYVYCLTSDGEHDEGSTWEAIMFAAKYKLNNLIEIIDRNNIQIGGNTEKVMPLKNLREKYESFNWAFTLLGGLLGYLGSFFTVSMEFSSILTFAIAILMLILGFQMLGVSWFQRFSFNFLGNNKYLDKNSNLQGKYVPIIVGAMTFLIPCGFTLIAQSNVLTSGSFVNGALKLLAFSLGTLPMLALISFSSVKFFSKPEFSKKFSLFAGALIIFFAFYTINSQLNVLGVFSLSDIRIAKETKATSTKKVSNNNLVDSEGYQTMQMEASGFEYFPKELYINANTKTRWEIYNSGAVGCASAVYGRGLYSKVINLKPGLNTVEFVSPESGTYKVSCSMGMVAPITVNVL